MLDLAYLTELYECALRLLPRERKGWSDAKPPKPESTPPIDIDLADTVKAFEDAAVAFARQMAYRTGWTRGAFHRSVIR